MLLLTTIILLHLSQNYLATISCKNFSKLISLPPWWNVDFELFASIIITCNTGVRGRRFSHEISAIFPKNFAQNFLEILETGEQSFLCKNLKLEVTNTPHFWFYLAANCALSSTSAILNFHVAFTLHQRKKKTQQNSKRIVSTRSTWTFFKTSWLLNEGLSHSSCYLSEFVLVEGIRGQIVW